MKISSLNPFSVSRNASGVWSIVIDMDITPLSTVSHNPATVIVSYRS